MRHLIPNSTQIPDIILDHWMAHLSGSDFKVLMYVARRTYGFGRESAAISLSQIANGLVKRDGTRLDSGTGGSRSSVARSLKNLEQIKLILRHQNFNDEIGDFDQNTYSINLDWMPSNDENLLPIEENNGAQGVVSNGDHLVSKSDRGWSQVETTGSLNLRLGVVSKRDYIRETVRETEKETAAAESSKKTKPREVSAAAEDFGERLPPETSELVERLVGAGLNRNDARKFATASPDESRRQLEYLPYKPDLENPGAYLRRAIEGSFTPPAPYLEAQKRKADEEKKRDQARKRTEAEEASKRSDAVLDSEIEELRTKEPERFAKFVQFVETQQAEALNKPFLKLGSRTTEILAQSFEAPSKRRELFVQWRSKPEGA
jgi:hypothetical protein